MDVRHVQVKIVLIGLIEVVFKIHSSMTEGCLIDFRRWGGSFRWIIDHSFTKHYYNGLAYIVHNGLVYSLQVEKVAGICFNDGVR